MEEIKSLQSIGVSSIHFDDDTFGINKKYIKSLCQCIIDQCLGIKWSCEIHVNLVDDDVISLMKKAGCESILIGIESGNNEIFKKIRKGFTIDRAMVAANIIQKNDILLNAFFMIGLPWETVETIFDTIKAIKKINASSVTYSIFIPYPGTEAFKFFKENKLVDDEIDISLYNHQRPMNCFCVNISKEKFREIAAQLENKIDKINYRKKLKSYISYATLKKDKDMGIIGTMKRIIGS